jgi:HEPN domain-containing protein
MMNADEDDAKSAIRLAKEVIDFVKSRGTF